MSRRIRDLRIAVRMWARQPAVAITAVATLALGIGANSAIFSVVNAALLTPPPFRDLDRVAVVWVSAPEVARQSGIPDKLPVSWGDFYDWQRQARGFARLAMMEPDAMSLTGSGPPQLLEVIRVSGEFAAVLGTPALLGRTLEPADDVPGRPRAVVLSYACWRRSFGGERGVIGRRVSLNREPVVVAGVMPPRFTFPRSAEMPDGFGYPDAPDAWVPFSLSLKDREDHGRSTAIAIGRLRAGVGRAAAESELAAISARLARQYPKTDEYMRGAHVVPIAEQMVGGARPALLILWAAVGFVLLIACANVANLLLARMAARQREIAVRTAVGAGRGDLIAQLLTESGVLAVAGGLLGLGVAALALPAISALVPAGMAGAVGGSLDVRVVAFTAALCAATTVLAGLAPALHASRPRLAEGLRGGARAGGEGSFGGAASRGGRGGAGSRRSRGVLLVAELALATSLLAGAGLLLRSFARVLGVDPGFRAAHTLAFDANQAAEVPVEARRQFCARLVERLQALPGVTAAAAVDNPPLSGGIFVAGWEIEGRRLPKLIDLPTADVRRVSRGYFNLLGIAPRRGRLFAAGDTRDAPPVAVIDEAMARAEWPGEDPIGKRIRRYTGVAGNLGYGWSTVVGVVGGVRYAGLDATPRMAVYLPVEQAPYVPVGMTFLLRAAGDPAALTAAARNAVGEIDRDQPLANVRVLAATVAGSLAPRRFSLLLLGLFAAIALALAAVGVYGLTHHAVVRRTPELGLRLALGARPGQLTRLLLRETGALVAAGLGLGLAAALALTRAMAPLLYGVSAADPATFAGVALLLAAAALLAAWLPGRRAARLDPAIALRSE
jgi:predicted permease